MKEIKTIKIPSGTTYLSEVMNELPKNVIFVKSLVGCGGTQIALTSKDEPYVIAVPFKSIIDNKYEQHPECLPIYSKLNNSKNEIEEYLSKTDNPKIIVTYDSLSLITDVLGDRVKNFNILIDEYHLLFTEYPYRNVAINQVIDLYTKYKAFTIMTATMLDEEFVLDAFKEIPIVIAEWEDKIKVKVNSIKLVKSNNNTKNLCENTVVDIIDKHLLGLKGFEGNAYFFVNSLTFINKILDSTIETLNDDNCRVIYSTSNTAKLRLKRSATYDKPKKINFLTATAFEGCDIYDTEGVTYIISSSQDEKTLKDISSSLFQIAGRIRNSKYNGYVNHIYTSTRFTDSNYEVFKQNALDSIDKAKQAVKSFNSAPIEYRGRTDIKSFYILYDKETKLYSFDENLVKIDLFNYKVLNDYSITIKYSDKCEVQKSTLLSVVKQDIITINDRINDFKLTVIERERIDNLKPEEINSDDQLLLIKSNKKYPFLNDAIRLLGYEVIKEKNYVITNIKRALIQKSDVDYEYKIQQFLSTYIRLGVTYSHKKLDEIFFNIYNNKLNINKPSKASDIEKYYIVKKTSMRDSNDIVGGYRIISNKIYFN